MDRHPTAEGFMTDAIRRNYIARAVADGVLPAEAHRMAEVIALDAPADPDRPIQFWQLHSVLGQARIVGLVAAFYERVFDDEDWFTSVFQRVGDIRHHINTQASMWVDAMGGGHFYHGAEFRLSFHHRHNAIALMTERGAERWTQLMVATLDAAGPELLTEDPRVRPAINTFLAYFMGKYAAEFGFADTHAFTPTNPPLELGIDLRRMTEDAIAALPEDRLRAALEGRGIDVTALTDKKSLVAKALML